MPDEPLARLRAAAAQYRALQDAESALKEAVIECLKAGIAQVDVVRESTKDRDTVRRWARAAGIPPAPQGRRKSPPPGR
jgi:hypothetical protein